MQITTLMSSHVVCVRMDDAVSRAKKIFDEKGFHHLLVVENHQLVGIISDRDLLKAISPRVDSISATNQDLATLNKRVHQIMTRSPISLEREATVRQAIHLFNEHKISCIPVVDDANKPIGIVSWRDIIRVLAQKAGQK